MNVAFLKAVGLSMALLLINGCADNSADIDGNGFIDSKERAAEMNYDAFIPMKAGLWETKFVFNDINVPTLREAQKQKIMDTVAKSASSQSCLTEAEGKKPGADFFGGNGAEKCVYKGFNVLGRTVNMKLSCAMAGMGTVDMALAGVMGATEFTYDSKVDVRLPMVGTVAMKGKTTGKYVGACPAS